MKFYMMVNYYLVSLCVKFHEDPCINERAGVVNAHFIATRCQMILSDNNATLWLHLASWNLLDSQLS